MQLVTINRCAENKATENISNDLFARHDQSPVSFVAYI